jgi:rod shape-determining protein MreC
VRAENRQLKEQIEQMRLQQVRLADDAAQARRLQTLLAFKEQFISRTVAAQVIGSSGSDHSRIVYIDKGENAGIKRDMAVMTANGIVGKVLLAFPSVAQVLLISDESSGVGALIENGRVQGVLRGTPNGEIMLEKVMSDEQVPVGEAVLTSGGDQIFPKGLPVGTVTRVSNGKDLFLNIRIKPAADLSKLEEVLVLVEKQERQTPTEDAVHMRASDILAQRLPSVPEKPVADAKSVAGAPGTAGAAAQPKSETKSATNPGNAAAAKPQGLAGSGTVSAKPLASPKTGIAASTAEGASNGAKNSSASGGAHISLLKDQPNKPAASAPTAPKTLDSGAPDAVSPTAAPRTKTEPDLSGPNPPRPQQKTATPSAPVQSDSQPHPDGAKPQ